MLICLFGGTGFIGESLVRELTQTGHSVRVALRGNEKFLTKSYINSRLEFFAYDSRDKQSIARALARADIAVNLIGTLHEKPQSSFTFVHEEIPALIAQACREESVPRMIHISTLGAREDSRSAYLRSKAAGEKRLLAVKGPIVRIVRPSVVLGKRGGFVRLILRLARRTPLLFLPCGFCKVQPVAVQDLVRVLRLLMVKETTHFTINIAGQEVFSMRRLVQLIIRCSPLRSRLVLPLDYGSSYAAARALESLFTIPPITRDNCLSMKEENLCLPPDNHALKLLEEVVDVEAALKQDFAVLSE